MWQVSSNKSVIKKTALRIRDIQAGHFAEAEHSTKIVSRIKRTSFYQDVVFLSLFLSLSLSHTHTQIY